jgi:GA4 desaturase
MKPERRRTPPPVPEGTVLKNTNKGNFPAFTADRPRVHGLVQEPP